MTYRGLDYAVRWKGDELEWEVYPGATTKPGLLCRGVITEGFDRTDEWYTLACRFAELTIDMLKGSKRPKPN